MTVRVTIKDEELKRKLKLLSSVPAAVLEQAGEELQQRIQVYPPEGPWNRPRQKPWYQRHFGPRWFRKDGKIAGRNTSERLQRSWQTKQSANSVEIFTRVSYAERVIGDNQSEVHSRHGWRKARDIAEDYVHTRLTNLLRDAITGTGKE